MNIQEKVNACTTLQQLLDVLNGIEDDEDDYGVDMAGLPTFGGTEPPDTREIWSWDENNLIVGTGNEYRILSRTKCFGDDA